MGISVGVSVIGDAALAAKLAAFGPRATVLAGLVVSKTAVDLTRLVKMNASGRPGPNAPTGDYRASWRNDAAGSGKLSRRVGTDRPQALRLEYGFVGADSLGRVYDQPPYPHFGPAVDVMEPIFEQAMAAVLTDASLW